MLFSLYQFQIILYLKLFNIYAFSIAYTNIKQTTILSLFLMSNDSRYGHLSKITFFFTPLTGKS